MPIPKPRSGEKEDFIYLEKKVVQRGGKWFVVHCHKPGEIGKVIPGGGPFDTKEEAMRMHRAIQANKKIEEQDIFGGSSIGVQYKEVPHPESVLAGEYPEFDDPPEGTKIPKSTDFYDEFDRTEKS